MAFHLFLLSEWIPQSKVGVTWVSLDEGDNDPTCEVLGRRPKGTQDFLLQTSTLDRSLVFVFKVVAEPICGWFEDGK